MTARVSVMTVGRKPVVPKARCAAADGRDALDARLIVEEHAAAAVHLNVDEARREQPRDLPARTPTARDRPRNHAARSCRPRRRRRGRRGADAPSKTRAPVSATASWPAGPDALQRALGHEDGAGDAHRRAGSMRCDLHVLRQPRQRSPARCRRSSRPAARRAATRRRISIAASSRACWTHADGEFVALFGIGEHDAARSAA